MSDAPCGHDKRFGGVFFAPKGTGGCVACCFEQAAAERDAFKARLAAVAAIAHDGGLRGMSEFDALSAIRRLTLPHWDKSGSHGERRSRVPDSADELPDLAPDTADIWCKHGVQTHVRRHCPLCHAEDEEHDRAMAAATATACLCPSELGGPHPGCPIHGPTVCDL